MNLAVFSSLHPFVYSQVIISKLVPKFFLLFCMKLDSVVEKVMKYEVRKEMKPNF